MKPKFKVNAVVVEEGKPKRIKGVHINIYSPKDIDGYASNIQYEFFGEDDWTDEDCIEYELVRK